MASHPDANPDSPPAAQSDDVERVSETRDPRRESVEDMPGSDGGTTDRQGRDFTR